MSILLDKEVRVVFFVIRNRDVIEKNELNVKNVKFVLKQILIKEKKDNYLLLIVKY